MEEKLESEPNGWLEGESMRLLVMGKVGRERKRRRRGAGCGGAFL